MNGSIDRMTGLTEQYPLHRIISTVIDETNGRTVARGLLIWGVTGAEFVQRQHDYCHNQCGWGEIASGCFRKR
jgi:hypothetical protein